MSEKPQAPGYLSTTYEDFSGVNTGHFANPYDALIAASHDDPVRHSAKKHAAQKSR